MYSLTFFFDRTFGKRLPRALNSVGPPIGIEWHQAQGFRHELEDDVWLKTVGERGWVVITQDRKFHKRENELYAVKQHGVRCFYLSDGAEKRWVSLCRFAKVHQRMINIVLAQDAPFIYEIKKNGKIEKIEI